jgi:hypothetical protein
MAIAIRSASKAESGSLQNWITRLRLIPDDCREFTIDRRRAEREFGIDGVTQCELTAAGLPHECVGDDLYLAACDLHYLGLRLGCATIYLEAMKGWTRALMASATHDSLEVGVRYLAYTDADTSVDVLAPTGRRLPRKVGSGHIAASFQVTMTGRWPSPDRSLDGLLSDIAGLDFCWIPTGLSDPAELARRVGLADCASASKLLVDECAARGLEARTAYGLLLSSPYSTPHNWAEVHIEERWTPLDPLLLGLLARFAELDGSVWSPARSPGAILLRLAECETAIVTAGERPIEATFLTEVRSQSQCSPGRTGEPPATRMPGRRRGPVS